MWSDPTQEWPIGGGGMWRYRNWLPPVDQITLGEPRTPLIDLRSDQQGMRVLGKLEGLMPTGSFKDRGSALLAGWLRSVGIDDVVIDSSGNAGASLAAYCAASGIGCSVYVPASTSPSKLAQVRAYGATVVIVNGSRAETTQAAMDAPGNGVYASHVWNPYFLAGTQTFAFEVVEQLGREPDAVVFPLGAGTLLLGAYLGFRALQRAGVINRPPRLYGVQAEACQPLAASFGGTAGPEPCGASLAEGILIAHPPRADSVIAAIRETSGAILTVSDDEIAAALIALARQGVYVEPTSAVTQAALAHLSAVDSPQLEHVVVLALTGHGLKAGAVIDTILESQE